MKNGIIVMRTRQCSEGAAHEPPFLAHLPPYPNTKSPKALPKPMSNGSPTDMEYGLDVVNGDTLAEKLMVPLRNG
jgi:hypothetical protein